MHGESKQSISITLTLNEAEARWLKEYIQNYGVSSGGATRENREKRTALWDSLRIALGDE